MTFQLQAKRISGWSREARFHPTRRWRADFLWEEERLILEVDGGGHSYGRHHRPAGYTEGCRKQAEAELMGFAYLRVTGEMVKSGEALDLIERFFAANEVKYEQ